MSNEAYKTQLSAMMDGELGRHELPFLLRRLSQDEAAVKQLGNYFTISDTLRRQLPELMDTQLVDRVRAALEAEPDLQAEPATLRRLLRPLAGLGVAASVAMVAVGYWSQLEQSGTEEVTQPASFVAATPQPLQAGALMPAAAPQDQWNRLDPDVQRRLRSYLVNHSGHASSGQLGGMLNYVRIAGQQQTSE